MSESTSSPYVHLHPISPSSSLSSTDSAPRSEPTSDEQPDLGAFTTVLREWTHLQPPPRIPVQIRSATSSTTPTFQPEQSVIGSDIPSRSGRSRNSRLSNRSGLSGISSFTRPPSSSVRPEGSTVWNHAPIALYLNSGTPSNDVITEDEEEYESRGEGEYTSSPSNSPASTYLTVEIASEVDFPSFDGSHDSNRIHLDSSPYPYHTDSGISLAVPLETNSQRLDSRETGHPDDEIEEGLRHLSDAGHGDGSSLTSRDFVHPGITGGPYSTPSSLSQSQSHDPSQAGSNATSVQLQSQAHAPTTTATSSSDSLSLPVMISTVTTSAMTHIPSSAQALHNSNDATSVNSSTSTSTLINALLTRNWNPLPPRTTSNSSFVTGSAISSNLSLLSYQIPETPPITVNEDSEPERGPNTTLPLLRAQPARPQIPTNQSATSSLPSTSSTSDSMSLKTQQSLHSSNSGSVSNSTSTLTTQRQQPPPRPFYSSIAPQNPSLPSNGSPLPNPHSPLPAQGRELPTDADTGTRLSWSNGRNYITMRDFGVVNDLGTPDQPPSETLLFEPPQETRSEFLPVDDDEDEEMRIEGKSGPPRFGNKGSLGIAQPSQTSVYSSGYDRPGPSSRGQSSSDRQLVPERTIHLEPQYEDDDDDDYPYRYPYSHTPRSHAQAMTPKGIPSQTGPPTQTPAIQTRFTLQQQLEPSSQSLSQTQNTLVQQEPEVQQLSRPPIQPQSYSQAYLPAKVNIQVQTAAPAPPATQTQLLQQYPYGYAPAQSSTTQLYPSAQSTSFTQTQELASEKHGYRHSLLGLHALPASLVSPEPDDLPGFEPAIEPLTPLTAQPLIETDSTGDIIHQEVAEPDLPSLGYLDEALSFIASERARWSAARPSTSGVSDAHGPSDSREDGGEAGSGEEGEGQEGEAEWKQAIEIDQDHPKRKRRRKRPPRSHIMSPGTAGGIIGSPPMASKVEGPADDSTSARIASGSSPKKKKRSKSASASTSARSLLLESPSKTKAKSKVQEKEFLVPPPAISYTRSANEKQKAPVTILRRPIDSQPTAQAMSEDDVGGGSDKDGGRTPTNLGEVVIGKLSEAGLDWTPVNLVGKKGKRVGRREREREKLRVEKDKSTEKGEDGMAGEDIDIEIEYGDDDDDDNVDDGVEPQEEDEDNQGENDSLSNMSLLQPPRRKRDRSRRRKGKDTAHIHSLIGIGGVGSYKSTPTTPRKFKFDSGDGIDEGEEDVGLEVKVEGENVVENDVFVSKPDEAAVGEKKKRTRTKRKTLSHARSDPQLRLDTVSGGTAAVGEDSGDAAPAKPRRGRNKAQTEDAMDILDMDRNQLQKHLSATSVSGSLSTNRPSETRSQPPPESKRGRLLTLAKKLSQFFPDQREELGKVIARIERQGTAPTTKVKKALSTDISSDYSLVKSSPIAIPGMKRRRSRKGGHLRTGSEGTGGEAFEFDDDPLEPEHASRGELVRFSGIDEEEEEEIDPRGRPPKKGDVLIHVFIDHSNILIGLLSHLKRHPPQRSKITANTARGRPLPALLTKATTAAKVNDKSDPASAFAAVKSTNARPLPIPTTGEMDSGVSSKRPQPVPVQKDGSHPIPLPSFATMSRSLPTGSVLGTYMSGKDRGRSPDETTNKHEKEANSDGYEHSTMDNEDVGTVGPGSLFVGSFKNKEKKPSKHLWHAALTLILERGRPITRRVVVTSSPLYQPMDSIERLGYELRVFIRVPDLGDGMDRERHRDKDRSSASGKSSGGGKSAQSSPATTTSISGLTLPAKKDRSTGHVRQISGNTSAESGSGGGAGSGNASGGGGNAHPYNGITNGSTPQAKIKYREQGVDELLQLKLHQALAATDDVPEGSTIVLATGDGNMGQFNEDGFLGPVRTALRRGWKVELYAWEDGLSRAWRREFGAGSEWGRKGMFQVIGMEQFASGLVEASGWS